jgi:hypothetical protein
MTSMLHKLEGDDRSTPSSSSRNSAT